MREEESSSAFLWVISIILLLSLVHFYNQGKDLQKQNASLAQENQSLLDRLDSVDQEVTTAKREAWSDYDNMGYTLEGLKTSFEY